MLDSTYELPRTEPKAMDIRSKLPSSRESAGNDFEFGSERFFKFERIMGNKSYPASPELFMQRTKAYLALRKAGVKDPGQIVSLLERIKINSCQEVSGRKPNRDLEKLYQDLLKPESLEFLKNQSDLRSSFKRLFTLGFDLNYDLDLGSMLGNKNLADLIVQMSQVDEIVFLENIKKLDPYCLLMKNFYTEALYSGEKSFGQVRVFIDRMGHQILDEATISSIRVADEAARLEIAVNTRIDETTESINLGEIKDSEPRLRKKIELLTILSSQNQAEPDIKEFRTTFSESGLKNLIFFTPEQVDTALYLTRAGWELSEVDYEKLSHEMDQMKKTQEKIDSDPEIKTRLSFIKSLGIPRFTNIDSLVIDSNFFNVFGKVQEYFSNNRERLSLLFKVSEKGRLSVDYHVLARFGNQIIKEGSFLTDDDRRFWQYLNLLSQHNCFEDDFFGQFAIKEKSLIVRHFDGETVDEQLPLLMKDGLEKYLSDHDCEVNSGELKSKVTDLYLSKMIPDAYKDLAKAYSSLIQRFTNDYYKRSYGEIFYEGMEDWEKMTKNGRLTPEFFYMFFDTKIMSISNNFWINELLDKGLITTFPESVRPFFTLYESNYYLRSLLVGHRKFFIETESGRQNFALLGQVAQTFRSIPSTVRDDIIENFFGKYLKRLVEEKPVSLEEEKEMILTLSLVEKAYKTPSGEFKRILGVVLPLIMQSPDPEKAFDSIESAYIYNRLPHVIKEFLVFKTIYSQTDDEGSSLFQKTLDKNIKDGTVNLSPTLKAASDEKRFEVIYRYLVGNAVRSNDTNLRQYLEVFNDVDRTLGIIDRHGAANATAYESDITRFLDRAEKLFFFVTPDKSSPATSLSDLPIEQRLENIARIVGAVSYHEIPGKISQLFLSPLGFGSIDEMLKAMDNHSKEATERNIAFAQKIMSGGEIFSPGDLLKSSQSQIGRNIFQTGLKCAEVLGGSFDSSNNTPFDADFSRVLETDIGQNIDQVLDSAVIRTAMTETNDIVLLVKDRGNLVDTSEGKALPENFSSYETFWSRYADIQYGKKGESEHRHYGVTVGVASTDINAVILTDNFFNDKNSQIKLNRLFFDIASGSCYIPVLNKDGKVVFTPEQYEDYKINGGKMRLAIKNIENFNKPSLTLIDVLKENPLFNQLFGLSVQVGEGYTLEQHTEMVLNIFDRYYRDRFMALNISREEFALMLALHDIGKPISDKTSKQHYFTRPIIEDIAKQLDISAVKKELIVEIASQDILGEYLKGEIDESDAKKEIDYIAGKTGITPVEIFWLCQYYWQCDVASYTSEADPTIKEGRFDKDINFDRERKRLSINNPEWIKRLENLKKHLFK